MSNVTVAVSSVDSIFGGSWMLTTISTGTNGFFQLTNVPAGSVTVQPAIAGYGFNPPQTNFNLAGSLTNLSFKAFFASSISGSVTFNGSGFPNALVTATTNNGVLAGSANTDSSGLYSITGLRTNLSYSVQVQPMSGYTFNPPTSTFTLLSDPKNINFVANSSLTISGRITTNGLPLNGVWVGLSNTYSTYITYVITTNGIYSTNNLTPGTYTVIPTLARYVFQPAPPTVTLDTTNVTSAVQNFTGVPLCNINGRVTLGGVGLTNVTVTDGTISTNTAANGYYTLMSVPGGSSVVVTPTLDGYGFTPASTNLALWANAANVNFTAFRTFGISGTLLEGTNPVSGALVSAGSITNSTGALGNYSLANLPSGSNYTVIPSKPGYNFGPSTKGLTLTSNTAGIDFAAWRVWNISGLVDEAGSGVSNLWVVAGSFSNRTLADGSYLLTVTNLPLGTTSTITPQAIGVGFRPASSNVTLNAANISNVNFAANPPQISIALSNRTPKLTVTGLPLRPYKVLANTNFSASTNWPVVTTGNTGSNAMFTVLDTNAPAFKARFYRPSTP